MTENQQSNLSMMIAISTAHFVNDIPSLLLPALLPLVIVEFGLNYAEAGFAIVAFTSLMTVMQAFTGYMADRMNRIHLLSLGLTILGSAALFMSISTAFVHLLISQFLLGTGASFYHPIGYSLLSDAYEGYGRGKIFGIGSAAGDAAAPVAFVSSGILTVIFGWRRVFAIWGTVILIVALAFGLSIKDPKRERTHKNAKGSLVRATSKLLPLIGIMALMSACYWMVSAYTTTYLTNMGLGIDSANLLAALMMMTGLVGTLIGGVLVDRLGERIVAFSFSASICALSASLLWVWATVYSLSIVCLLGFPLLGIWPAFYMVIAKTTSLGNRASVYGTIFATAWGIGSLFPYISGTIADIFELQAIYIIVSTFALLATAMIYFVMKN